ncbi:iron-containing alcohol dehydrogenase [Aquirhabdus parva]|uniref:Iron-containing alcohol dehydrogenase n=1 Tax=Aquirhabdus parva TaxID=2283318 RepID=A0A345P7Q3_9GAMM|nr:iron-containing alcohol dehydrogenase [Aquirhabdus parva]AXI03312.1 iron-containing alcohol dehydrogenase [Aquirhabdus parva]
MSDITTRVKAKAQLAAIKVIMRVMPAPRPLVLVGADSSLKLCATIAQLGVKRVLVVTDAVLYKLGVIHPIETELQKHGIKTTIYSGVTPDPTFSVVEAGLVLLKSSGCDSVLAIGGGSAIDAAKVIALSASNQKTPQQLVGILKARKASLPLFVIPTTAGTGSEVSAGAVVSDDQTHQKGLVLDTKLVPLATALDPVIMQGMPKSVTADTGLDALTHALEAWMSEFASSESDFYAGAAVRLIFENLPTAWADGRNLAAREAMALASHYAGLAMNQTALGYIHAIAHQLGAYYGVPHGRANSIVMPHVLEFNRQASEKRLALLAEQAGIVIGHFSSAQATDLFIQRVKSLLHELEIDTRIPRIDSKDFPAIIKGAFAEAHGIYAVPKYMTSLDAEKILHALKS